MNKYRLTTKYFLKTNCQNIVDNKIGKKMSFVHKYSPNLEEEGDWHTTYNGLSNSSGFCTFISLVSKYWLNNMIIVTTLPEI